MKDQGFPFYDSSNFQFIPNSLITDVGKFSLLPFNVILTSFQSISMISYSMCFFNVTCSESNFHVNLNRCILPTTLHNFTGTECWASDINSIIFTSLENRCPLNTFNFLTFRIRDTTIPNNEIINMHIVYNWLLHVHSISYKTETCSCLVTASTSFICCKSRRNTDDFI